MDIVSRLKSFIGYLKVPVTQFADNSRIPRPSLSQLLSGRNRKVSDEVITKIHSAYPQLNMLWLLFGEGEMVVESKLSGSGSTSSVETTEINKEEEPQSEAGNTIDFSGEFLSNNEADTSENHIASNLEYISYQEDKGNCQDESSSGTSPQNITGLDIEEANNKEAISSDQTMNSSQQIPISYKDGDESPRPKNTIKNLINFNNSGNKTIVNIIIYYSDNSYESFIPESTNQ